MELYLVKEEVKILKVSEAFSKTNKYNDYVRDLEEEDDNAADAYDSDDALESHDGGDRTLLTLSNLPVALKSICSDSDVSEHSELFAKRVERNLTAVNESSTWEMMKLELIISNDRPNSLEGYLLLSTKSTEESKLNVFKRLDGQLGFFHVENYVQVSLCHLPTENAPVSPECLVNLEAVNEEIHYNIEEHRIGSDLLVQLPRQMIEWWERGTGIIYSKTSVKIRLRAKAVDRVYGHLDGRHEGLLKDGEFTDVEIRCQKGEIVTCHRALLANKSCVLHGKFKEMLEKGQKVGPWKLEMGMSKKGVDAFLEYIYCGRVSRGMSGCDGALELLLAAAEYQVVGLPDAMEEIIMAKGSSDFGYFSVKSALDLFLYARNMERLKHLRDKAVRVLQNYLKTASDKILKSKEYQFFFKNQPQVAMELSSLFMQLS